MNMIGHNILADLRARVNSTLAKLAAITKVDASNAKTVKDMIDGAKALQKEIEETHKQEKEPHLAAGRAVDAAYKPLAEEVVTARAAALKLLEAHVLAEKAKADAIAAEARRKAEELAKAAQAAEAEDPFLAPEVDVATANTEAHIAQNAAITAGRVTSASGTGRASGLRTHRYAEVKDAKALVTFYAEHPDVLGAATKLANAAIRAAKGGPVSIPGVEVKEEQRLS
jgi:Fe2+ transport system protein B